MPLQTVHSQARITSERASERAMRSAGVHARALACPHVWHSLLFRRHAQAPVPVLRAIRNLLHRLRVRIRVPTHPPVASRVSSVYARSVRHAVLGLFSRNDVELRAGRRGWRVSWERENGRPKTRIRMPRTRKSKTSVFVMAAAMSFLCKVLLLLSSECIHDRSVSSRMKSSHACSFERQRKWRRQLCERNERARAPSLVRTLANSTGASALIMRTSSSDFIICDAFGRGRERFGERQAESVNGGGGGVRVEGTHLLDAREGKLVILEHGRVYWHVGDLLHLRVPKVLELRILRSHPVPSAPRAHAK